MQASYGEARRSARSAKAAGPAQTNPDAYVFFDICAAANAPVTPRCVERIALGGTSQGGVFKPRTSAKPVTAATGAGQAELWGDEQWQHRRSSRSGFC